MVNAPSDCVAVAPHSESDCTTRDAFTGGALNFDKWMHHHQVLLVHHTVKWSVLINVDYCAGTSHGYVSVVIVVIESEFIVKRDPLCMSNV